MKRVFPLFVAVSLLAAAGPAAAQSPAPQPPQPPATTASPTPEPKASGERTLNLRLDDASRRRIMSGSTEERPAGAALPSLGGDARPLDRTTPRTAPFTKGSNDQ